MTKFSKLFGVFLVAVLIAVGFVGFYPKTIAQAADTTNASIFIVNATSGVNVRDKDCKKISGAKHQAEVFKDTSKKLTNISCTVNGVKLDFTPVAYKKMSNDMGYIATKYLSPVLGDMLKAGNYKVANAKGLNVRDQNCKRINTLSNNTAIKINVGDAYIICKVSGKYYFLQGIEYKGKTQYAATIFIK